MADRSLKLRRLITDKRAWLIWPRGSLGPTGTSCARELKWERQWGANVSEAQLWSHSQWISDDGQSRYGKATRNKRGLQLYYFYGFIEYPAFRLFHKIKCGVSRTSQQTKKKSFQIDATCEMLVSDKWLRDYLLVAEENPTVSQVVGRIGSKNWDE